MSNNFKNVERYWGKVPVVDAKKELRVFILPDDVRNACPKDADSCVFALACKRACGASRVLFFRTVAYVELPDARGKLRVERLSSARRTPVATLTPSAPSPPPRCHQRCERSSR